MFGFYPVASAPIADDQAGVSIPVTFSVTGLSATASLGALQRLVAYSLPLQALALQAELAL